MTETQQRRTKRRYAHELYPIGEEGEVRDLAVEVPYLLARANGLDIEGTSWMDVEPRTVATERISHYLEAAMIAFLADALHQGLTGNEAYAWAREKCGDDNTGEWLWERADHYGVNPDLIKPYPCGPEPDHHDHLDTPDARGWRTVHRITGPESACPDCAEPITEEKN